MIGDGDEDREDRRQLMNPKMTKIGIYCNTHKNFDYCSVVVLAQEFKVLKGGTTYIEGEDQNPIMNDSIHENLPAELKEM